MAEIATCLWFDTAAEEAARCYVGLVPGSRLGRIRRPAADAPAVIVDFSLAGVPYLALSGGPQVRHSPAASIVVTLPDQASADALWQAHLAAGSSEVRCGWMTDRWGLSWQIVPAGLHDLLFGPDPGANARAYACLQGQTRIDLAAIAAAAQGT